jgi:hypothetical protein
MLNGVSEQSYGQNVDDMEWLARGSRHCLLHRDDVEGTILFA